jgi:low affinity Fe/Cu permease
MTDNTTARTRRSVFGHISSSVTRATGSSYGFLVALSVVLAWAACGPLFGFSSSWQLIINTGTTIITFLMVFVIQHAQNKDTLAIHLKLNELIASNSGANNRLVDIEEASPEELAVIKKFYGKLAVRVETASNVRASHSLDEASASAARVFIAEDSDAS